jgi:hypothetical protein
MARGLSRTLSAEKLRELARNGAEVALKRLRAEIIAIERAFPDLALPRNVEPFTTHWTDPRGRKSSDSRLPSSALRTAPSVPKARYRHGVLVHLSPRR